MISLTNATIDCADARRLAEFWCAALDYRVEDESSEWSYLVDAKGAGVPLFLQVVPEAKSVKNRVHLDYASTDAQAEAERLSALGATIVSQTTQESGPFFVMADPEGNEFCIAST